MTSTAPSRTGSARSCDGPERDDPTAERGAIVHLRCGFVEALDRQHVAHQRADALLRIELDHVTPHPVGALGLALAELASVHTHQTRALHDGQDGLELDDLT